MVKTLKLTVMGDATLDGDVDNMLLEGFARFNLSIKKYEILCLQKKFFLKEC